MSAGKFPAHHPGSPWPFKGITGSREVATAGPGPAFLGQPKQLLDLESADGLPRIITVGLNLRGINTDDPIPPKCRATLQFGSGAGIMKVDLDFINGTLFRIPCTHLRLDAQHEDPVNVTDANVYAWVSYDVLSTGKPAQRTVHVLAIAPGAEFPVAPANIPIPEGATSVRFLPAPKHSTYTLEFLRVGGPGGIDLYDVTVPADTMPPDVPISNWAKFMRIFNEGAAGITQGELIFSFPF